MMPCAITGVQSEGVEQITLPGNPGALWVASSTKTLLLLGHTVEEILAMQVEFDEKMKEKEIRLSRFVGSKFEVK